MTQQITPQNFIRLGIAAFKEHELREIVVTFCKLPGIAPQPGTPAQTRQVSTEDERKAFEQWSDGKLVDGVGSASRHRYEDGYCQSETNAQWKAWKARAALSLAQRPTEPEFDPIKEALEAAEEALNGCYEVQSYPGDGSSGQDVALAKVRNALSTFPSTEGGGK